MHIQLQLNGQPIQLDLSKGIDISLPISDKQEGASAWYCPPPKIEPVMTEHFVGDVNQGGAVNFRNVFFNPHGNGTHTECLGHIAKEWYSINDCLEEFFFLGQLVSIAPKRLENGDRVIDRDNLSAALAALTPQDVEAKALLIRTLPNNEAKRHRQYTNTNPPYMTEAAMHYVVELGIKHLLIDTPSVDREEDGGALAAHHIFWSYPEHPRQHCTITELIYVPSSAPDGWYFINLQVAAFDNDASPSRPMLFLVFDD